MVMAGSSVVSVTVRQGVLEARFACEGHPVIRIFTHHVPGRILLDIYNITCILSMSTYSCSCQWRLAIKRLHATRGKSLWFQGLWTPLLPVASLLLGCSLLLRLVGAKWWRPRRETSVQSAICWKDRPGTRQNPTNILIQSQNLRAMELFWNSCHLNILGFLPKDETLAIFDDGKRLWVPPVALQGLLPAALLEVCLGCTLLFYHVLRFESL